MIDSLKILLIDDDEVDRMMARRALKAAGVGTEFAEAGDGKSGLAMLASQSFDVVLLDYGLPDMEGFGALQAIRRAGFQLPIIMLTGQGDERLAVEMVKAGANDYLSKTRLSRDLLGHSVRHAVRLHRAQIEASRARDVTAETERRFRTMADSAPVLLWVTDPNNEGVYFNQGWLHYTGRTLEQELGHGWAESVHPEDRETVVGNCQRAFDARERFQMEFRLRRASGAHGWVLDSGAPRFFPDGTFAGYVGSCVDITDRKRAEEERAELLSRERAARAAAELSKSAAQASEQHYRFLAESIPALVWTALADGRIDYVNRRWVDYTGMDAEASMGAGWLSALHPEDVAVMQDSWERSQRDGSVLDIELRYRRAFDETYRWHIVRAMPFRDSSGRIAKWFGTGTDIEDQKRTRDAMTFLADASVLLASSLNTDSTLASVANLAVQKVADWCFVDVVAPDGPLRRVVVAHQDAAKKALAEELVRRYPIRPETPVGSANVLRTGQSELYEQLPGDVIERATHDRDHATIIRSFGLRSLMIVPMVARGRVLGAITLATAETERFYTSADLALAEDLARRAAAAVDNARLYRDAQTAFQAQDQAVALLDTLLEKAPVGLAFFDANQRYVRVNETLAKINGIPPAQHLGKTTAELHSHVPAQLSADRDQVLRTGEPVLNSEISTSAVAGDNLGQSFLVSHYPVRSSSGEILGVGAVMVEITPLRQAEEALRISRERMDLVVQASELGVWYCDLPFGELIWNDTCKQHFGLPTDAKVTIDVFYARIHPEDRERTRQGIERSVATHTLFDMMYRTITPGDGRMRWVRAIGRAFYSADNVPERFDGITIDVTATKLAEERLQRATAEADHAREVAEAQKRAAEAANHAKDQFLAVLSHELRTPLTPVLSTVQAMESDPSLPADLRESIDMIRRNVELEARLIDDLLDLTRISKGKLELHLQTVDAHEALTTALDICRSDILDKGLKLEVNLGARRSAVVADSARLHQVFWNLIKNAVKFTPAGGTIFVSTRNEHDGRGEGEKGRRGEREKGRRGEGEKGRRGEANNGNDAPSGRVSPSPLPPFAPSSSHDDRLIVEVRDTGIGIEPSVLPRIFDAFEQGERSITRKFGGLGLGLAISKALIDMQAGRLTAASPGRGAGSTFGVDLALTDVAAEQAIAKGPARSAAAKSDLRILLVDDHLDTALAMRKLLERLGYRITIANTLADAVASYNDHPVDLVISDIGLPDGSGLELIRLLKDLRPVTGIALSGFGMEEDVRKSKEAGFYEHLTKPVNFQRLHALIREATATLTPNKVAK